MRPLIQLRTGLLGLIFIPKGFAIRPAKFLRFILRHFALAKVTYLNSNYLRLWDVGKPRNSDSTAKKGEKRDSSAFSGNISDLQP